MQVILTNGDEKQNAFVNGRSLNEVIEKLPEGEFVSVKNANTLIVSDPVYCVNHINAWRG